MTRVSAIIPFYRNADTIARALDSVYRQTHPVAEVIVVNDCSPQTEELEQILQSYPHVTYIRNAKNLGLAGARNKGIAVAGSEVLAFLDADDEWHPQKTEFQIRVLRNKSAVACAVRRVAGSAPPFVPEIYQGVGPVRTVVSNARMVFSNSLTGASMMIAKDLVTQIGGYDAALRSCEDYDLWLRLLEAGAVVYNIERPLYIYHFNKSGLSNDYRNVSSWELEVIKKYCRRTGRGPCESFKDCCIWAWWMLKHLARTEMIRDDVLKAQTIRNIELLSAYPSLKGLLKLIERSHVLRLYSVFK